MRKESQTTMMIFTSLFSALTVVGTFIKIPVGISHITLQYFFAALAGIILGPKWGVLSQIIYVAVGLVGFPVFSSGGGIGYLLQPSFGFIIALVPCTAAIALLTKNRKHPARLIAACISGDILLYLIGLPYMYLVLTFYMGRQVSFSTLMKLGMLVYLPGDALKIAAVAMLAPSFIKIFRRLD